MTPEKILSKQIQAVCGENNIICFDVNVGGGQLITGSYFRTGLPRGFSDLLLFTSNGKTAFIETKIKPRKPTQEQINFINTMKKRGFIAGVVYDINDFINNYLPLLKP
ncbi:MAG TPA: VRR-NUC domain-containing protein [Gelidibacter sp.]|jgi:hypothetical protein|uniref:VRR-NUC domain-containing protein n=1 Tax=Gelidibacter sp. TaxID=2018083 RepID=UPI002C40C9A6|nr:VRR-NUC domain-containing protein [Gelidibacter sp.]HXJ97636.1 VRR-NUC domain-containing protein [Gelidibacter sp.]